MTTLSELRIPHSGSVENAKLVSWLIAEGAAFSAGQALYEIETDKTVMEVEAEADGVLARCEAEVGAEMKVGDRVGWTAPVGATASDLAAAVRALDASSSAAPAAAPPAAPTSSAASVDAGAATARPAAEAGARLSPLVRRLAAEHGVDLATVTGTGAGGKITGDDVLNAAKGGSAGVPTLPGYEAVAVKAVANSSRRKAIARRLLESARNTATLTADMQIDLTMLLAARERLNSRRKAAGASGVSVLSFIAHDLCKVLRQRPDFNASYTESHTLLWQDLHLGVAVDSPEGLVVPVIRHADQMDVEQLDAAVRSLAARAREGKLQPADLEGATFTLSNPGSLGPVLRAEAVLNPPQVALLGLPAVLRVPVAVQAEGGAWAVEVRPVVRPSLSFDHRALDGGQVIAFLDDLRQRIETLAED